MSVRVTAVMVLMLSCFGCGGGKGTGDTETDPCTELLECVELNAPGQLSMWTEEYGPMGDCFALLTEEECWAECEANQASQFPECSGDDTGTDSGTGDSGETADGDGTDSETDTGPTCGASAEVCCEAGEPCAVTADCCEPELYACALVGASMSCVDLAAMCQSCMESCAMLPPDVCEGACAQWCNPP